MSVLSIVPHYSTSGLNYIATCHLTVVSNTHDDTTHVYVIFFPLWSINCMLSYLVLVTSSQYVNVSGQSHRKMTLGFFFPRSITQRNAHVRWHFMHEVQLKYIVHRNFSFDGRVKVTVRKKSVHFISLLWRLLNFICFRRLEFPSL